MTVHELQSRISSSEFTRELAYDSIQAPDPYRSDMRLAYLAFILLRLNGNKNLSIGDLYEDIQGMADMSKAFEPEKVDPEKVAQTIKEILGRYVRDK